MLKAYYETVHLVERLHRHFLELLKVELDREGLHDINNVQSLILYNIGDDEMTVGELTARGCYLGSNVSYNVRRLVENGYLVQQRSIHDRRSIRVRLTDKGLAVRVRVTELLNQQANELPKHGISEERLQEVGTVLGKIERFWNVRIDYPLIAANGSSVYSG